MSRVCSVCGKGKMSGNNVSHSHLKTKRTMNANVQKVEMEVDGKITKGYMCTKCMKGSAKH